MFFGLTKAGMHVVFKLDSKHKQKSEEQAHYRLILDVIYR